MTGYQGVIFDMDGLLFDTEKVYMEANIALASEHGLTGVDEAYMRGFIGISDAEMFERLKSDQPHISEEGMSAYIQSVYNKVKSIFETGQVPLKPGARELLVRFKEKEIPCVIASSNMREVIDLLIEKSDIHHYFSGIVSADDVTRAKPDPEIVVKATKLLNLSASHCLMLEDSINGVRAAYSAGVDVMVIPDLIQPNQEIKEKAKAIHGHLLDIVQYF